MTAASPFRWFLGLLALFTPVAATACRAGASADQATMQQPAEAHVVFRHYL